MSHSDTTWRHNKSRPGLKPGFVQTLEHVDSVDSIGRLRCILILARHTGRRESSICHLQGSDSLGDETPIRETLASMGLDDNSAQHMPHGAIR